MQTSGLITAARAAGACVGVAALATTVALATTRNPSKQQHDAAWIVGLSTLGVAAALTGASFIGNYSGAFQQITRNAGLSIVGGAVGIAVGGPLILAFAHANNPR